VKITSNIKELKSLLINKKQIGFIPTMGALHNGHISLIEQARRDNEIVVVSIFVNPTQFLIGEDLNKYPTQLQKDIQICKQYKVDILFTPTKDTMYQKDEVLIKAPILKSFILEGQGRPGHFDGVLQIVLKFFNIINPTNAYFGKKDAQQLILVKQMVKNLFLNINIIGCDIIRSADGLALSSRNIYLTKKERKIALSIPNSLKIASQMIKNNILDCNKIISEMTRELQKLDIEYIFIVNHNLDILRKVELNNTIVLVAVKINSTRLIDNIWL
jgi:pantoate--beta-alanine ligase